MKSILALALLVYLGSAFDLGDRGDLLPLLYEVEVQARITNGHLAAPKQFPYQVGLALYKQSNTEFCGGSIISNQWILSAAHCTIDTKSVHVYMGSVTQFNGTIHVANEGNIINHKDFVRDTLANDISLIKISPITFTVAIQPVALPKLASSYPSYVGVTVTAAGWGRTSDSSQLLSPVLMYADFKVASNEVCVDYYGSIYIRSGKLCIATANRIATCSGDSGGPLVISNEESKVQIGIASYGSSKGCESGFPKAFTRVTAYLCRLDCETY